MSESDGCGIDSGGSQMKRNGTEAIETDERENRALMAGRHVASARRIVARQHELVARLKAAGCSTKDAEYTLGLFVGALAIFEQHERELFDKKHTRIEP
jgi:hypothetical protein